MIDILKALDAAVSETAAGVEATDKLDKAQIAANERVVALSKEAANLETTLVQGKNAREAQVSAETDLLRSSLKGNISEANNLILANAKASEAASNRALELQNTILQKQKVSFFEDPLAWFEARYTIDDDMAQYDAASKMASNATGKIREIEATLSDSNKARLATAQTLQADELHNKNQFDALKISMQQGILEHQLNGQNIASLDHMKAGRAAQVDFELKYQNMLMQLAAEARQERGEARQQALFESQMDAQAKKLDADKNFLKAINYGASQMQQPAMTESELDNMSRLENSRGRAILGTYYNAYLQNAGQTMVAQQQENARAAAAGEAPRKISPNAPTIGLTPAEVLQNTKMVGARFSNDPKVAATLRLLESASERIQASQNFREAKPNDKLGVLQAGVNALVKQDVDAMKLNAEMPGSIMKAPDDPKEVLAANPQAGNSAFFIKVVQPQLVAGRTRVTSADMLSLMETGIKTGTVTAQEAATGIAQYYRGVGQYNTVKGNFQGMAVGKQESYRVKVPMYDNITGLGTDKSIDLTNPSELALYHTYAKTMGNLGVKAFNLGILKDNERKE